MQKTEHLELNTWAEADPVSLEEINQNFELLDEHAAAEAALLTKHEAALKTLALHTACRALEAYHSGLFREVQDNLLLADFSKSDDRSAVSGVRIAQTCICNSTGTYTGYQHDLSTGLMSKTQWKQIDSFEAMENGNITSMDLPLRIDGSYASVPAVNIRLKDGETVIAEYPNVYMHDMPTFEACPITVGHTYTIEAISLLNTVQVTFSGRSTVVVTPESSESGYVITREYTVNGSNLYFWVTASGDAPDISVLDENGTALQLTAEEAADITDLNGSSAKRYFYKLRCLPWETVRIKADITGSTSIPYICGISI